MSNLAVQDKDVAVRQPSAMEILQMAVNNGAQIDTIERLAALQQQMFEREAKTAYNRAMHAAQSQMRTVGANKENTQTHSWYATFERADAVMRPVYSRNGFSLSFDTEPTGNTDVLRVVCDVAHVDGHTVRKRIDMPADGKGAKGGEVMTRTHATGSAFSYGKRYLLLGTFNVSVGEKDDDGNAAAQQIKPAMLDAQIAAIESAKTPEERQEVFKTAYVLARDIADRRAMLALTEANDKAKAGKA